MRWHRKPIAWRDYLYPETQASCQMSTSLDIVIVSHMCVLNSEKGGKWEKDSGVNGYSNIEEVIYGHKVAYRFDLRHNDI